MTDASNIVLLVVSVAEFEAILARHLDNMNSQSDVNARGLQNGKQTRQTIGQNAQDPAPSLTHSQKNNSEFDF